MFLLSFAPSNSFIAIFFFYIEMMAELYDIICPTLMDHRAHKTENTCFRIHIQVALWGWKKKAKSKGEESFPTNPASVPRTGWMDATEDAAAKDSKPFIIIFFFSQVDPTILGCLSLFFLRRFSTVIKTFLATSARLGCRIVKNPTIFALTFLSAHLIPPVYFFIQPYR